MGRRSESWPSVRQFLAGMGQQEASAPLEAAATEEDERAPLAWLAAFHACTGMGHTEDGSTETGTGAPAPPAGTSTPTGTRAWRMKGAPWRWLVLKLSTQVAMGESDWREQWNRDRKE